MRGYMRKRRKEESVNNSVNSCKQSLAPLANKDKDKDKYKDKDKPTTAPAVPAEFADFRKAFPKRSGAQPWSRALTVIRARLKDGSSWSEILAGTERYAKFCDATTKTGTEYVMQAATFCGPEKHFLEPWEPPATKSELRQDKNIDAAHEWLEASSGQ